MPKPKRKNVTQAARDFEEFLKDEKHKKPTKPEKPIARDERAVREDPAWRKEGKEAPPGWVKRGDTFEEE